MEKMWVSMHSESFSLKLNTYIELFYIKNATYVYNIKNWLFRIKIRKY